MKTIKTSPWFALVCACLLLTVKLPAQAKGGSDETNLLSWARARCGGGYLHLSLNTVNGRLRFCWMSCRRRDGRLRK